MKVIKTYFVLMVSDMARATQFYVRSLALTRRFESKEWTELNSAGVSVALHSGGKGGPVDTGLAFEVDDIRAACTSVREAGGTIVKEPEQEEDVDILLATVADPDGNRFTLAQTG